MKTYDRACHVRDRMQTRPHLGWQDSGDNNYAVYWDSAHECFRVMPAQSPSLVRGRYIRLG